MTSETTIAAIAAIPVAPPTSHKSGLLDAGRRAAMGGANTNGGGATVGNSSKVGADGVGSL